MYSAVSVGEVWVWVEGGVAAKCWRPPIYPARWLKKWLLLTELTRKFVFLLRAGNEKKSTTDPISRKTAASLFKFSHLCSKITRKSVHKLISNNNHIWGCHPNHQLYPETLCIPSCHYKQHLQLGLTGRELRPAVSWTCCLSTLRLPRQDQSRWLDPKHEPN